MGIQQIFREQMLGRNISEPTGSDFQGVSSPDDIQHVAQAKQEVARILAETQGDQQKLQAEINKILQALGNLGENSQEGTEYWQTKDKDLKPEQLQRRLYESILYELRSKLREERTGGLSEETNSEDKIILENLERIHVEQDYAPDYQEMMRIWSTLDLLKRLYTGSAHEARFSFDDLLKKAAELFFNKDGTLKLHLEPDDHEREDLLPEQWRMIDEILLWLAWLSAEVQRTQEDKLRQTEASLVPNVVDILFPQNLGSSQDKAKLDSERLELAFSWARRKYDQDRSENHTESRKMLLQLAKVLLDENGRLKENISIMEMPKKTKSYSPKMAPYYSLAAVSKIKSEARWLAQATREGSE